MDSLLVTSTSCAGSANSRARHLLPYYKLASKMMAKLLPVGQVEIKTSKDTPDIGNLQRAADFIHAFLLGTSL